MESKRGGELLINSLGVGGGGERRWDHGSARGAQSGGLGGWSVQAKMHSESSCLWKGTLRGDVAGLHPAKGPETATETPVIYWTGHLV